jgi:hypothetical protein
MRVKLIGVSDKTRKSESVNRTKYGLLFGNQRQPLIMDAKFLRSTTWLFGRLVAKSALCGGISGQSDAPHYQHIAQFGTAAIGISFHFFLH